jgi:hypothetical protein
LEPTKRIFKNITSLHAGQSFGELALTNRDGKREARITCEETTHLGVICKPDYDNCLEKIELEHQAKLLEFI